MELIKGKIIVLGDDVDTDQILPGYAMAEPYDKLGSYAMAGLAGLDFNAVYEPGSILVAGRNFGCGSSREQAPIALKQRGVSLILAKGFAGSSAAIPSTSDFRCGRSIWPDRSRPATWPRWTWSGAK